MGNEENGLAGCLGVLFLIASMPFFVLGGIFTWRTGATIGKAMLIASGICWALYALSKIRPGQSASNKEIEKNEESESRPDTDITLGRSNQALAKAEEVHGQTKSDSPFEYPNVYYPLTPMTQIRESSQERTRVKSAGFHRLSVDLYLDEVLSTKDYVVLDTETTGLNAYRDKIVQIALVTVENGEVTETFSSFVNPKCHIPFEASRINHITDADLVDAPTAGEISAEVLSKINGKTVVAHNADFDIDFLKQWYMSSSEPIQVKYIDTLGLSRKAFPNMGKYSLQHLIDVFGLDRGDAHRADSDALATQQLFELCKAQIPQLPKIKKYEEDMRVRHTQIKPTVEEFDESHPLYKKAIVFTGYMEMPRADAMQKAVNCGALLRNTISRRTNYLVLGELLQTTPGITPYSRKRDEVEQLNQSGEGHIKIITEQEFYELLGDKK